MSLDSPSSEAGRKAESVLLEKYVSGNDEAVEIEIIRSREDSEILYRVREPDLTSQEKGEFDSLKTEINDLLPDLLGNAKHAGFDLETVLDSFVSQRKPWIVGESLKRIRYYLIRDFKGYGLIDPLVKDQKIEDVSCDGPDMPIFVYHSDYGSIKTNLYFKGTESLDSYIIRLAQISSKSVSINSPILDSITRDGHRVQAVYGSEISSRGPVFTLRLFREKPFTPVDIIRSGTASSEMMAYLWFMIESYNSALIVGAPGAGKTSTLNALLLFAPDNTKIFSIEETRELNIPHENWVAAETREKIAIEAQSGVQRLNLFDLVTVAMRQRPTYIVVGEVRGKETYALFQAMATGHTTYSTIHADSMESLLNRLENEPMNIPRVLVSYLNIVIFINFIRSEGKLVRRITEIDEIAGIDGKTNEILYNRVFWYDPDTDGFVFSGASRLYTHIQEQRNIGPSDLRKEIDHRKAMLSSMLESGTTEIQEVSEAIQIRQMQWSRGGV